MAERQPATTSRREEKGLSRPSGWGGSPLQVLHRMADEVDQLFGEFGLRRRGARPRWREAGAEIWAPEIEVFQQQNELTIRADLPGLKKEEVSVEITDDAVTIQGERKHEHEEEREGFYRSERSYGSFYRLIPLPEGAITDQAKARFRDGVLEITMPAPPASTKGRRLEITEGAKK